MKIGSLHRVSAILLGLKWSVRIFLGIPGILRIEIQMSNNGATLDFLLALKDEDSLLSHGASPVISSMGSCC